MVPPFDSFYVNTSDKTYFRVEDGFCYPTALDALNHAITATFTLSQNDTVGFSFWDTNYIDNSGGISLEIRAVPIPGAVWLLGSGLVGIVGFRRKFKK